MLRGISIPLLAREAFLFLHCVEKFTVFARNYTDGDVFCLEVEGLTDEKGKEDNAIVPESASFLSL